MPDAVLARAPGRVNLVGGHLDYNGGPVLPAAVGLYVWCRARRRPDRTVVVRARDLGQEDRFALDGIVPDPRRTWPNYVRGMAAVLQEERLDLPGAELEVWGDLPRGRGLSSSAALELAVGAAWWALTGRPLDRRRLALAGQRAEHAFVGVRCGLMDQWTGAFARPGHVLRFHPATLETAWIPWPAGAALLVLDSGVRRELAASEYNRRRAECAEAARVLGVPALAAATREGVEAARERLGPVLYRRARHVVTEVERVEAAAAALAAGDPAAAGRAMTGAHASLRDDYQVSCPELDTLVELALDAGAWGARMTGAGFGGSVVALVPADRAGAIRAAVLAGYRRRFPDLEGQGWVLEAVGGAEVLEVG